MKFGDYIRLNTREVSQLDRKTGRYLGMDRKFAIVHIEGFNSPMLFLLEELQ